MIFLFTLLLCCRCTASLRFNARLSSRPLSCASFSFSSSSSQSTTHLRSTNIKLERNDATDYPPLTPQSPVPPSWSKLAAVLIVPLIWGTYSPLIKKVYSNSDVLAPPPLLFNFLSYLVSVTFLNAAHKLFFRRSKLGDDEEDYASKKQFASPLELQSGIELGLWLFAGSTVQIMGIQSTTATRAAILVQLTTIIVPIFESVSSGRRISPTLWSSCLLALAGVSLVTVDSGGPGIAALASAGTFSLPNQGDMLVLLSAVFYSLHVVRLGRIAGGVSPIRLARVKSLTELSFSGLVLGLLFLFDESRWAEVASYLTSIADNDNQGFGLVAGSIVWNGAVATALTNSLQAYGQKDVSPTTANLLYTTQPMWASLFSFIFLHDRVSTVSLVGILVLVLAVGLSTQTGANADRVSGSEP